MKTLSTLVLVFSSLMFHAQDVHKCYTMQHMEEQFAMDPSKKADWESKQQQFEEFMKNNPAPEVSGSTRVIPVVFHIIHVGGTENISKAQILDQMRILNEDFLRMNPDTVNTPVPFKPIAANTNIEFRLAQKDPNGNCTDGIVRKYSPLSVNARDNVKAVSYWPSNKYFNVWVVKTIDANGSPGVILGYAQFPGFGSPLNDGVVLRHDVVGSIGTALTGPFPTNNGRTLSHEAGHWFNLRHIWGDATCGNDQVSDTPVHEMANSGCPSFPHNVSSPCNPGPNGEMFTNYMDYTDGNCQNMFSTGQSNRMNSALTNPLFTRQNLWTAANLTATGCDGSPAVLCAPVAAFYPAVPMLICAGDSVQFKDMSWNGYAPNRTWNFQGGAPSTSTDSIEWVTYSTPGTYSVTLTVNNTAGTNTATKTGWIVVSANAPQYSIWNYYEGFDSGSMPSDWATYNLGGDAVTWTHTTATSWYGGGCVRYLNTSGLVGQVDELVSPSVDMTAINGPKLYYYVAYAQRNSSSADRLRILVSTNCGENWTQRSSKQGATLSTIGPTASNFLPTQASQWRMETVTLTTYASSTNLKVKFEFTSDGGNNIYIDHINMTGTLGVEEGGDPFGMNVFPNPVHGFSTLYFDAGNGADIRVTLKDITGREVLKLAEGVFHGEQQFTFDSGSLPKGVYLLNMEFQGQNFVRRLVIQ